VTEAGASCNKGRPRYRWEWPASNPAADESLARALSVSPLVARCLANRGCSEPSLAASFLQPRLKELADPFELPDMPRAVARLAQARARAEPVVLYGDYDADGITATALLSLVLKRLGFAVSTFLPDRFDDGYGLTVEALNKCRQRGPCGVLLAIDCGSASPEAVAHLQLAGIDAIVLDHHTISDPPPVPCALVNPQVLPESAAARNLCSAGLAFKLAHALLKQGRADGWDGAAEIDLKEFLDLAALGTIADLVPLRGENRVFARHGLDRLAGSARLGLQALKRGAGLEGTITARQAAFQLAPRLNASGRLESAEQALDLLLTADAAQAESIAAQLDRLNRDRQGIERTVAGEAIRRVRKRFDAAQDFCVIEGSPDWHIGVVGIVASRVVREFYRPAIVFGGTGHGVWRGSGRSIAGFDLAAALRDCRDLLLRHGGHAMAAGLSIDPARLDEFRARFNQLAQERLPGELLVPPLELDATIALREMNLATLRSLEALEPHGQGNPPVRLAATGLRLAGPVQTVGANGQHLKFRVTDGRSSCPVIWWSAPENLPLAGSFDLAFTPELNEFNGTTTVQLTAIDLKTA